MRYFFTCDFDGSGYVGWQRQLNGLSVQQEIEEKISLIMRTPIGISGCGRTDAGVHGTDYVFHADVEPIEDLEPFLFKLNQILPEGIWIKSARKVSPTAHARFNARSRQYRYSINLSKSPLSRQYAWTYPLLRTADRELLQVTAAMLTQITHFGSFRKQRSVNKTTICKISHCRWEFNEDQYILHISSNRFLRGMVRLIVGACINVAMGKITLDQLKEDIATEQILPYAWSVPARGLMFTGVEYVDIE